MCKFLSHNGSATQRRRIRKYAWRPLAKLLDPIIIEERQKLCIGFANWLWVAYLTVTYLVMFGSYSNQTFLQVY